MQQNAPNWILPILLATLATVSGCTDNPLFKEDRIKDKNITGKVELSDRMPADNVHVWLDGCNVSRRTNAGGFFELSLPSPKQQPGGGLNGAYTLYFYVANYQMGKVPIYFLNGRVEYSKGGLNSKGELLQTMRLNKILDIKMTVEPPTVYADVADTVTVSVTLQATDDTVTAKGYFSAPAFKGDPTYTAGFIRGTGDNASFVKRVYLTNKQYGYGTFPVTTEPLSLVPLVLFLEPNLLAPGEYEIIPFLVVKQAGIPQGLLNSLSGNLTEYTEEILNVPLKIRDNHLRVLAREKQQR